MGAGHFWVLAAIGEKTMPKPRKIDLPRGIGGNTSPRTDPKVKCIPLPMRVSSYEVAFIAALLFKAEAGSGDADERLSAIAKAFRFIREANAYLFARSPCNNAGIQPDPGGTSDYENFYGGGGGADR
jgi:hypothetical protein